MPAFAVAGTLTAVENGRDAATADRVEAVVLGLWPRLDEPGTSRNSVGPNMRLLRTLTVWLLMAAASGTWPVAVACLDFAAEHACGDACERCICKRHSPTGSLRAPCPCCGGSRDTQAITALPPAVLPDDTAVPAPPSDATPFGGSSWRLVAFIRSVPHPPPRSPVHF